MGQRFAFAIHQHIRYLYETCPTGITEIARNLDYTAIICTPHDKPRSDQPFQIIEHPSVAHHKRKETTRPSNGEAKDDR